MPLLSWKIRCSKEYVTFHRNDNPQRALAWAAYGGHLDLCRLLVNKYKADSSATNIHNQIPLDLVPEQTEEWKSVLRSGTQTIKTPKIKIVSRENEQTEQTEESAAKRKRGRPRKSDKIDTEVTLGEEIEIESASLEPLSAMKRVAESIPTTQIKSKLISSLGIVSNGNILRNILPTDMYAHSITTDNNVRTLNFRILLSQKGSVDSQVMVYHNSKQLNQLKQSVSDEKPSNVQDYNAVLTPGMNNFEVFALSYAAHDPLKSNYETETYSIFINRLE